MADEEARDQPATVGSPPSIGGVIRDLLEAVSSRSRKEVARAQSQGRLSMERRQLERDRNAMLAKLGRETIALLDGGEVDHPGLRRGAARIAELDARILGVSGAAGPEDPQSA
jgi:hypothetical protein